MQQFLGEIRRDYNIPIILVTQDLSVVNVVADKVTIYSQGKIAQIGSPVEIGRGNRFNIFRIRSQGHGFFWFSDKGDSRFSLSLTL
jgi:ABC-type sulfate/molybdate transport systems ATPase subunit